MASIDKVGSGWRARWRTPDGRSRSKTFTRKIEAQQQLVLVQHQTLQGAYVDVSAGNVTVAEYLLVWLARQVHRPSSEDVHRSYMKHHIVPFLGDRRLRDVRPGEVQAWVHQRSKVLGPTTLENVYRFVAAMFASAVTDRLIASSPCVGVKLPKTPKAEVKPLEPNPVRAIADAIGARWEGLVIAGATLGMRQGELLGLTVDRVDFLRRTVRVDRQLVTVSAREPFLGPVKTAQSVRTIPASQVAIDALSAHLADGGPGAVGLIFAGDDGLAVRRPALGHVWRKAVKKAGLEGVVFHQLRHTPASILIGRGVSVPAVARNLGHSPAICLKTYAHMWASDEERIRQAIDEGFCVTSVSSDVAAGF